MQRSKLWCLAFLFPLAGVVEAGDGTPAINNGDTAWMLMSAALVMFMTPGLAFFYGGLVRKKNVLSILMQCFMVTCLISVQWVLFGYSLSFGPDRGGIIGSLENIGLRGLGVKPTSYAATVPGYAFVAFQMMFAVITPGLIIGAFVERMRFAAFCLFSILWVTLVYNPLAHWVWGAGGFMGLSSGGWGTLDFAGGIVVHISAGFSALAAALVLGKRHGYPAKMSPPHSLPIAVLGAGMLWFGWFGFNAGSALTAGANAATAFLVTHTAGSVAGLVWAAMDWMFTKRPTMLGMITGAVAGLASVTPASGFIDVTGAIGIGIGAGVICWLSVMIVKNKLGYDDSLDAFGVHGIGGLWGTLAAGIWCTSSVNSVVSREGLANGGGFAQLFIQFKAVALAATYSFVASIILLKLVDLLLGLRVSASDESVGLDLTQHKETGYTVID
jgi:ammonium transporter, Amt family